MRRNRRSKPAHSAIKIPRLKRGIALRLSLCSALLCLILYVGTRPRHPHPVVHNTVPLPSLPQPLPARLRPQADVPQRLREFGAAARNRLKPHFIQAGIAYPPHDLTLVGLKQERRLELYVSDATGKQHFISSYPILAASGHLGPKYRLGDYQVPEGFYRVVFLNANSRFHVSLRLDYPNRFDFEQAAREHRTKLGGDIMIHGSNVSAGCLAMGDVAAEDLFTLAADTG